MSHFNVAVIHREDQSIDELLEPYDENIEVEPYIDYTKQMAIEHARRNYAGHTDALPADATDEQCWKYMAEDYEADRIDGDGNLYTTYNPKSKWDWWTIGGRWSGLIKTKDGDTVDECRIGEMDLTPNQDVYNHALRFWDVYVDKKPLKPGETEEQYNTFYRESYFKDRYLDCETYAKCQASFMTRAVVTPDGEWHEAGEMGWFGCSSETDEEWRGWAKNYQKTYIESADPDLIITIVDCHI